MPTPIPWSDLEGPCATAWYWPEATERMKNHKSHIIVSVVGTKLDKIDNALLLTKIVSAVAECASTAGIYWGAGTIVHSVETFKEMTEGRNREILPLYAWVDFRVIPEKKNSFSLFTTGFKLFDIMEIEIIKSKKQPNVLIDKAFNMGHYILDNGPVVKNGDTIGFTAGEKIKILHKNSMWDKSDKVYQLKL